MPSVARHALAVERVARAGQRGGAERQPVDAARARRPGARRRARTSPRRPAGGAEAHRLRHLQVREAGQDGLDVCARPARPARAAARASSASIASISPRSHSRTSVATWSLRERPVCSRLPASPTSCVSRASMLRCTSSSVELPLEAAGFDLLRDLRHAALDRRHGRRRADDALRAQHLGVRQQPAMSARHRRRSKPTLAV